MRGALAYLSAINLLFILLLSLSGAFGGWIGEAVCYLAFAAPILLTLFLKSKSILRLSPPRVKISRDGICLTLASAAPSLALVFFISCLTSLILSRFGFGNVTDVSGNLAYVIFSKALFTAILEEALFRYIPLALLAPYSRRGAIIYSALFFALVHCNPYQIPYALAAGVIFALLDLACDSVMPSVILHFLNNLISIFWLRHSIDQSFARIYVILLVSLALLSLPVIFLLWKRFAERIRGALSKDGGVPITVESVLFIILTLSISFTAL